jgi:hypothetical protein
MFSQARMSEDKVRTKDSCWSVGTIYDPRELPGVSTASLGVDGVLHHARADFQTFLNCSLKPILVTTHFKSS